MCQIWPLHLIIFYLLALCPMWVRCTVDDIEDIEPRFRPDKLKLYVDETKFVWVTFYGSLQSSDEILVSSRDEDKASSVEWVDSDGKWNSTYHIPPPVYIEEINKTQIYAYINFTFKFRVKGISSGRTEVNLTVQRKGKPTPLEDTLPVMVQRRSLETIRVSALRISFGLGFVIFPDSPDFRLAMFFTGVSSGVGGLAHIWAFIIGGNLNLSLPITYISALASFLFMPAWLYSLSQEINSNTVISVPYEQMAVYLICLIVTLAIGYFIQKRMLRLALFMIRILKRFAIMVFLFIFIFTIVTYLYIYEFFDWNIIIAGMCIPWLGFFVGYLLARIFQQPHPDALVISMHTGMLDTGIAIYMLRYTMLQPDSDIAIMVPIAVAVMSPIPIIAILIFQAMKAFERSVVNRNLHEKILEEDVTTVSETPEPVISPIDVGNTK